MNKKVDTHYGLIVDEGWFASFTDESSAKSYYLDELLPYCLAGLKKGTGKGKRREDRA